MYAGEVIEQSTAAAVTKTPRHPYTQALIAAVPSVKKPRAVAGIAGRPPAHVVLDRCSFSERCPYCLPACTAGQIPLRDLDGGHRARCIRAEEIASAPRETTALPIPELTAPEPLLALTDVWCEYGTRRHGTKPVVKGVSLEIRPGETVGIVGESGSGKSTLLRAIAGLHPPVEGTITLHGKELARRAVDRPRSGASSS
jgi:peptide/nickel transport system ATP-binding protein